MQLLGALLVRCARVQYLLIILRPAVCRVRQAHSKAHTALGDTREPPASPLSAWPDNSLIDIPAATNTPSGAPQLAAAQREAVRLGWDLSVLKRTIPELEAAAVASGRVLEVRTLHHANATLP